MLHVVWLSALERFIIYFHPPQSSKNFFLQKLQLKSFHFKKFFCLCLLVCVLSACVFIPHGLSLVFHPSRWKAKFHSENIPLKSFHFEKLFLVILFRFIVGSVYFAYMRLGREGSCCFRVLLLLGVERKKG